jgi:flagellar protein FliO/FliZ
MNQKGVKFLKRGKTGLINIVETRPVGARKVLCLVEVRGRELLLGIGGDRIDFLCQIGERQTDKSFDDELKESIGENL